ncbi:hypothetical protein [Citrobacter freundii]|uniref:hypothetical protein n=1 Tax=Citrobacter freundii TaxID=546 RepID=UPI00388D8204
MQRAIETPQPVTNIYNISFDTLRDEPAQNKVTISTDKFEVKPVLMPTLKR